MEITRTSARESECFPHATHVRLQFMEEKSVWSEGNRTERSRPFVLMCSLVVLVACKNKSNRDLRCCVLAALILGIQSRISVHWVASSCPGCMHDATWDYLLYLHSSNVDTCRLWCRTNWASSSFWPRGSESITHCNCQFLLFLVHLKQYLQCKPYAAD